MLFMIQVHQAFFLNYLLNIKIPEAVFNILINST